MFRCFRFCLPVLVLACAVPALLAQEDIYSPVSYTAPSLLGPDGNLYGTTGSGLFELNLSTGVYSTINSSLGGLALCSVAPDGTLLGVSGFSLVKVTLQGTATTFATLPYATVCPVLANDGNYYGGDGSQGTYSKGYLYQLSPAGKVTVLYNFTGGVDGIGPNTPMLQASDGNLYGVGVNQMFRFSAADGLTAYSNTAGISGPLYESSNGEFSAISGANLDTITLQGAVTSTPLDVDNDEDATYSNGNFFLGGNGSLFLEEYYSYYGYDECGGGNFFSVYQIAPGVGILGTPLSIGGDESGSESSDQYSISEFLAGRQFLWRPLGFELGL